MILTCPECATRYQTDATKFPPQGRNVRCAKCGHVWHQAPQQPEPDEEAVAPAPAAPAAPVYERPETPAAETAPRVEDPTVAPIVPIVASSSEPDRSWSAIAGRLGTGIGWLLFIAVILAIGWAALTYRQQIAGAWPQSASLYSAIGKPVNTRGLEFRVAPDKMESEDGQPVLVITGEITNVSSETLSVPEKIRIGLSDEQKREIYSYTFASGVTTLAPGQSKPFSTRLANPPAARRNLEVRFVHAGE